MRQPLNAELMDRAEASRATAGTGHELVGGGWCGRHVAERQGRNCIIVVRLHLALPAVRQCARSHFLTPLPGISQGLSRLPWRLPPAWLHAYTVAYL